MIIQATPYGTKKEEPFAFTYSGDFTDSRVDGVGTVRLNTSGTLTVTGGTLTVIAKIAGAGGGAASNPSSDMYLANGGTGGYQSVEVSLAPGAYVITIGTGGVGAMSIPNAAYGTDGGDTSAFGYTSTGGTGGYVYTGSMEKAPGTNGTPSGAGGEGGIATVGNAGSGGDGYVELTFS